MQTADMLKKIYKLLFERYGHQNWWPGESRFEVVLGAILTQNTNWQNVEKAINNLKEAEMLCANKMFQSDHLTVAELIRPAGYYNVKTKRIKSFLEWLFDKFEGKLENLEQQPTDLLREDLLSIKGIGKETADSILLYGFERPVFVVDAYTARMLGRHKLIDEYCDYEEIRELFESSLSNEHQLFNEYHALIVRLGKDYCKKRPKCEGCPLEHLPHEIEEY